MTFMGTHETEKRKNLEGRKLIALLCFLLCTLQKTINRRVVNKYYSDLGMWNRRYKHEILFLLLSLCWWSSGHFSGLCNCQVLHILFIARAALCPLFLCGCLALFPTLPNGCDLWAPSTFCLCLVQASNEYETYNHQLCTEINE